MRVHAPFRRCLLIAVSLIAGGHGGAMAQASALVGAISRADLRVPPFSEWFDSQYSKYQAAPGVVADLKKRWRVFRSKRISAHGVAIRAVRSRA